MKKLFPFVFAVSAFLFSTSVNAETVTGTQIFEWTGAHSGNITLKTGAGYDAITINEQAHTIIFHLGAVMYIGHYTTLSVEPIAGSDNNTYSAGLDDINEMEAGLNG